MAVLASNERHTTRYAARRPPDLADLLRFYATKPATRPREHSWHYCRTCLSRSPFTLSIPHLKCKPTVGCRPLCMNKEVPVQTHENIGYAPSLAHTTMVNISTFPKSIKYWPSIYTSDVLQNSVLLAGNLRSSYAHSSVVWSNV
jgi:hypothetical protein